MLPIELFELRACEDAHGRSPFDTWFHKLAPTAAAKVAVALARLGRGGGTKKKQPADIKAAKLRWVDYKARKRKDN